MTAINAKSEALQPRDLCSEELDAVSGGFFWLPLVAYKAALSSGGAGGGKGGEGGGQNDPAQMFQQILQQLTQGGKRAGADRPNKRLSLPGVPLAPGAVQVVGGPDRVPTGFRAGRVQVAGAGRIFCKKRKLTMRAFAAAPGPGWDPYFLSTTPAIAFLPALTPCLCIYLAAGCRRCAPCVAASAKTPQRAPIAGDHDRISLGSYPSTSVVPPQIRPLPLNHKRFKGFNKF